METIENFDKINIISSDKDKKYNLFVNVVNNFKILINHSQLSESDKIVLFDKTICDFYFLKENVIKERINETILLKNNNHEMLKLSTFELMEHNFKENTHSNILKYLFDYDYHDNGHIILYSFLTNLNSIPDKVIQNIHKKNYTIQREVSTKNGRIDLLILDKINKFVIVIENKLLSSVSKFIAYNEDESETIIKTQLDKYTDYINFQYLSYDKIFVLLSFINIEQDYHPFITTNYENLFAVLKNINSGDNIVFEYRILLQALINNITNKEYLIKTAQNLNCNNRITLNTIEEINKLFVL